MVRNVFYGESLNKPEKLNGLFRNRSFNFVEFVLRLFEPYYATNENIGPFAPSVLEFLASLSDSALFKSVLNSNYQTVMALLRSFDEMARSHLPQIHTYLDVIIKNNNKDPGHRRILDRAANDTKKDDDGEEEADGSRVFSDSQPGRVAKGVLIRKGDEVSNALHARRNDKSGALPNQDSMDKAWKDSPAGKFHDDAKDRMRDGTRAKLDDEEKRKKAEEEKARQAKIDKDNDQKKNMVGGVYARINCSKTG